MSLIQYTIAKYSNSRCVRYPCYCYVI